MPLPKRNISSSSSSKRTKVRKKDDHPRVDSSTTSRISDRPESSAPTDPFIVAIDDHKQTKAMSTKRRTLSDRNQEEITKTRLKPAYLKNRRAAKALAEILIIYSKLNDGDTLIPYSYRVPKDSQNWPKHYHGMQIGKRLDAMRFYYQREELSRNDIQMLECAGIVWKICDKGDPNWHLTLAESLYIYKELYGHTKIPIKFDIPNNDTRWPEHLRNGAVLGDQLNGTRYKFKKNVLKKNQIDALERAGIIWYVSKGTSPKWYKALVKGLPIYHKLYGDTLIPKDYTVPSDDSDWPESLYDLNLGAALVSARLRFTSKSMKPDQVQQLEHLGIIWKPTESTPYEMLADGLSQYRKLNGNTLVPSKFKVPHDDIKWPKRLLGFKLRQCLKKARKNHKNSTMDKLEITKLEQVGIVW